MGILSFSGIEFVTIPKGIGIIGRLSSDNVGRGNELGYSREIFNEFCISKYPITQKQYYDLIGINPSYYKIYENDRFKNTDSFPVESVSWHDANYFCHRLTEMVYGDNLKFRLPTEREWEYACRGSEDFIFQSGNDFDSTKGNIQGNYPYGSVIIGPTLNRTCEVGLYEPNIFGLYDMHGNVWEWCMDEYKSPSGIIYPNARVLKGGAWNCYSRFCRTSYRCINEANKRYFDTGFRVVLCNNK